MFLPNVWGAGSLFAFSGLDGETQWDSPFVGALSADRVGIWFHTQKRRLLSLSIEDTNGLAYEIVASDIIKLHLTNRENAESQSALFCFISQDTVAGCTVQTAMPEVFCKGCLPLEHRGMITHSTGGEHTALALAEDGGKVRFAFSFSSVSVEDAAAKAAPGPESGFSGD